MYSSEPITTKQKSFQYKGLNKTRQCELAGFLLPRFACAHFVPTLCPICFSGAIWKREN